MIGRTVLCGSCLLTRCRRLSGGHPRPRVINMDGNPSYPHAVSRLKRGGETGSALPVLDLSLPEQHRRPRPIEASNDGSTPSKASDRSKEPGEPSQVIKRCARSGEGKAVAAERGCGRAGSVHQLSARAEGSLNHSTSHGHYSAFRLLFATLPFDPGRVALDKAVRGRAGVDLQLT
jgi:hypothetical protein